MSIVRQRLISLMRDLEILEQQAKTTINVQTHIYAQEQEADRKANNLSDIRELPYSETRAFLAMALQEKRDARKALDGIAQMFKNFGWKYTVDDYGRMVEVETEQQ